MRDPVLIEHLAQANDAITIEIGAIARSDWIQRLSVHGVSPVLSE
jgi:hypothetical protein